MKKCTLWLLLAVFMTAPVLLLSCRGEQKQNAEPSAAAQALYICPMHPQITSDKPGSCPICGMDLVKKEQEAPVDKAADVQHEAHDHKSVYICPMHPQITSEDPKYKCPICGMDLVEKKQEVLPGATEGDAHADHDQKELYICPMHPQITSDRPGSCPICGMDLVIKKAESSSAAGTPEGLAPVRISQAKRGLLGLTFGAVEKRALSKEIRTSARIVPDETRLYRVTTKIDGYVDRLYVNVTGQEVKQGAPLLTIYSPELVASQEEFLTALDAAERFSHSSHDSIVKGGRDLVQAARRRLKLWDISDAQIARLEKTRTPEKHLTLLAPASGHVIKKELIAGQTIMAGDPLLEIADLTVVWADADIYESDLPYVREGMPVRLTLPYWPGKEFRGQVSFLYPYLDSATRTLQARMEIKNPDLLLKGDMYAEAHLQYELGDRLAVPETAVMNTGTRSYVFKAGSGDEIIPAEVTVGLRTEGFYEVQAGLSEGDRVVTSANFLIDSESSLKAALQAITGGK